MQITNYLISFNLVNLYNYILIFDGSKFHPTPTLLQIHLTDFYVLIYII